MSAWHYLLGLLSVAVWTLQVSTVTVTPSLSIDPIVQDREADKPSPTTEMLLNLTDGVYQLCTEPEPEDWRDGEGACLNTVKQGTTLNGYYGYPHSDSFVCLQGQLFEESLSGTALVVSWSGHRWAHIPEDEFTWNQEGRLQLSQGYVAHREGEDENQVRWIVFRQATLNMQGLYLYPESRMTEPTQLCDWSFNGQERDDDESVRYHDTRGRDHPQFSNGDRSCKDDAAEECASTHCSA
ncbi:MAG: hypothetical protein AAGA75_11175 [Cyanobacteria bacterium P01_E01_bin.6]